MFYYFQKALVWSYFSFFNLIKNVFKNIKKIRFTHFPIKAKWDGVNFYLWNKTVTEQ